VKHGNVSIAGECENGMQGVRIAAPLMRLRFALVILAQFRTVLRVEFGSCTQIGKPYQQVPGHRANKKYKGVSYAPTPICAEAGHIAGALRSTRRRPNPRESGHPEAGTTASTGGAGLCRACPPTGELWKNH